MKIQYLEWDSNFFNKKIGYLELSSSSLFDSKLFVEQVEREGYELVYVYAYDNFIQQKLLTEGKLELIDIMLTMVKENIYHQSNQFKLHTNLTTKQLNECYNIADQIAKVSRFYNDKDIGPEKAKMLYRKWVENASNETFADGLLLEKEGDKIIGFHIVKSLKKSNSGICSLIGVDEKYKGRGIGTKLWNQANLYWSNEKNIKKIKVPFSLQNIQSFNFHVKMGFDKVSETKYIYHYRTNKI